jgi:hypothetical protein
MIVGRLLLYGRDISDNAGLEKKKRHDYYVYR